MNKPTIKEGKIKCEICGKYFESLNSHLTAKHKLNSLDYRIMQGYSICEQLTSDRLIKVSRDNGLNLKAHLKLQQN